MNSNSNTPVAGLVERLRSNVFAGPAEDQRLKLVAEEAASHIEQLEADKRALVEALTDARIAIDSLDEDELGRHPELGHPYRDELLAKIDATISNPTSVKGL